LCPAVEGWTGARKPVLRRALGSVNHRHSSPRTGTIRASKLVLPAPGGPSSTSTGAWAGMSVLPGVRAGAADGGHREREVFHPYREGGAGGQVGRVLPGQPVADGLPHGGERVREPALLAAGG